MFGTKTLGEHIFDFRCAMREALRDNYVRLTPVFSQTATLMDADILLRAALHLLPVPPDNIVSVLSFTKSEYETYKKDPQTNLAPKLRTALDRYFAAPPDIFDRLSGKEKRVTYVMYLTENGKTGFELVRETPEAIAQERTETRNRVAAFDARHPAPKRRVRGMQAGF